MYSGQNVTFRRSDGTWSKGVIQRTVGDIVIVEWKTNDGRHIGRKFLQKQYVRQESSFCLKHLLILFAICIMIGFFLFIDHYYDLKQVLLLLHSTYVI